MTPENFNDYSRKNDQEVHELNSKIASHVQEEKIRDEVMLQRISDLTDKVKELTDSVDALLSLWNQAKGVITFIKWVAYIGGGFGTAFVFFKDHWK